MPKPVSVGEMAAAFAALTRYPHVAIAVSGGPDSLAALTLIARWRDETRGAPKLTALTVDHRLRQASTAEALDAAAVAQRLGVPHQILVWERSRGGAALQVRAREARYGLMAAYCQANGIQVVVTAHHLDDQAETVLMRLKRGSGLDGLGAIPEESAWGGIAILRPFLDVPKARLVATLNEAGIAFATDPSNEDHRFERARLRAAHEAMTQLGLEPAALALSAKRLRRARTALDDATAAFLCANAELRDAGYCLLSRNALLKAPEEIALRALGQSLAAISGRPEPLRLAKLEALLAALAGGAQDHTLAGCRLKTVDGTLGVFREARRGALPALELAPGATALWDHRFLVALGSDEPASVTIRALGEAPWRAVVASAPWLASVPRLAGITLPACYRNEEMPSAPSLGRKPEGSANEGGSRGFRAKFVNRGWAGSLGITFQP